MAANESTHRTRYPPSVWLAIIAVVVYLLIRDGWLSWISSPLPPPFNALPSSVPISHRYIPPAIVSKIEEVASRVRTPVPLRDYALAADGGMVFDELTSPRAARSSSSSPELALDDDMRIGRCWQFTGSSAQLSISLPDFIYPTHITIDHIPRAIAANIGQAPRRMILWAVIDGSENRERLRTNVDALHRNRAFERNHPSLTREGYAFVELADFVYDITQQDVQTFAVREVIRNLRIDIGLFVLEILQNWGADTTCVYRVRLHGEARDVL